MGRDEVRIRAATRSDFDVIGKLWTQLMDFHTERDPHFVAAADGVERFIEYVGENTENAESWMGVAETDGGVVGYCSCKDKLKPPVFARRRYGLITDLVVDADWRKLGIGRRLVEAGRAWFDSRGLDRVEVRVATTNEVSTVFWRRMGFRPCLEELYLETGKE